MITIEETLNQNWDDYRKLYIGSSVNETYVFILTQCVFRDGQEIDVFENPMVVIPFKTVYDYMTNTTTTKNIDMNNEVMQCVFLYLGEVLAGTSEDELEMLVPEILERTGLKEWNDPRDLEILGENM
jgi:hypothetical protein